MLEITLFPNSKMKIITKYQISSCKNYEVRVRLKEPPPTLNKLVKYLTPNRVKNLKINTRSHNCKGLKILKRQRFIKAQTDNFSSFINLLFIRFRLIEIQSTIIGN